MTEQDNIKVAIRSTMMTKSKLSALLAVTVLSAAILLGFSQSAFAWLPGPAQPNSPLATATSTPAGHRISSYLNENQFCLSNYNARGIGVELEPTGRITYTDLSTGLFVFDNVADGDYVLDPQFGCGFFGCWPDTPVTVAGVDVFVTICPVPPPTPTPMPTFTPMPTSTPTPTATPTPGNVLVNGDFESGPGVGWTEVSSDGFELITTDVPHTGDYSAHLCGYDNCTESIQQQLTIPSNGRLTYFWYLTSQEGTVSAHDFLKVQVYTPDGRLLATLRTLSNRAPRDSWQQDSISLAAGAGRTVVLRFTARTDLSLPTTFYVDDVGVR